jgi:biopolymer transport protein ExbD
MHHVHHRLEPRPLAAMLPTVHVMVLLLLLALGITPAITGGTKLPTAKTAAPAMKDRLTVGIDRDGRVWIGAVPDPGPVPDRQLAQRLGEAYAGRRGEEMYLVADRSLHYARVQQVIQAARQAGVREVQLIVECPRGGESLTRQCRT